MSIVGIFEAGFGDEDDVMGNLFGELFGGDEVGGEGLQVTVVDTDEIGAEVEGAFHFGEIVDLDEDVELHIAGGIIEFTKLVVIKRGDDEEDV